MINNVWVVTELYYPEETSTGYFLTKIAEGIGESFKVNVLCVQPTYSARGMRAPEKEKHNGVNIIRCRATTLNKDKTLWRLINILSISFSIFFNLLRRIEPHDIILVVTNPPSLPFLTALACRLRGSKYLLLVHDIYPEVLIVTGAIQANGVLAAIGDWFSRQLYRNSEKIIVLGRDMRQLILNKCHPAHYQQVNIIPNWSDIDHITPSSRDQNLLLHKLGLHQKFVIQYSGNMGRTHGLETIIAAAKELCLYKDIHFLFCGTGAKKKWLQTTVSYNNLANVTILDNQPRSELNNLLNACDVAIISFLPGMSGVSVPSRMYNILAAGKPIIAVAEVDSELALVVNEEQVGWVVTPNNVKKLVETIVDAASNKDLIYTMGRKARSAAERKYSWKHVRKEYISLIGQMDRDVS